MWNQMKSLVLLSSLTALVLWIGHAVAGQTGLTAALLFAGVMNFGAYWWSDRLVLRMHGARELHEREAPRLHALVRRLAHRAGLPMPRVYLVPGDAPNAFATGRNPQHGAVAVTEGLLRVLDEDELAGVLAHELGHIKSRDTLIMTVAATLAGAIMVLADLARVGALFGFGRGDDEHPEGASPIAGLLGALLAPIAAMLIQFAISRSREFVADETAARLSGDPLALANALQKIEAWSRTGVAPVGSPATAHLFIVNPFVGAGLAGLFSTHPSTEARIERLVAMARVSRRFVHA